jgi:hypothetical protein
MIHVFEIGKVNIDGPFERPEGLSFIITVGIVNPDRLVAKGFNNADDHLHLGNEMRRRYKAYPADSLVEDGGYLPDYLFEVHAIKSPADPVIADLVILAIDALKIAVGEKDIADPAGTADGRLLPFVNADGCNAERSVAFAISCLPG